MKNRKLVTVNNSCIIKPPFRKKSSYLFFSVLLMMGISNAQAKTCSSKSVSNNNSGVYPSACTNDSVGEDITSPEGTTLTVSGSKPSGQDRPTAAGIMVSSDNGNAGIITNAGDINGEAYARGIQIYQSKAAQEIINTGNINVAGHAIALGYYSGSTNDGHLTGVDNAALPDGTTYNGKMAIYNSGTINATGASGNTDGPNWGGESGILMAGFEPKDGKVYATVKGDIVNDTTGTITGYGYGINQVNSTPVMDGNIINKGKIEGTNRSGIRIGSTLNGNIENQNSITGGIFGIENVKTISGDIINNSGSTIQAGLDGIYTMGSVSNITNKGTITGANSGITNSGTLANIVNSNTITGTGNDSAGINNTDKGTISGNITNNADATISAGKDGISNSGSIANIENSGTIKGGANNDGIYNQGNISGDIINNSGATIQAGLDGIGNIGTVANIKNNGTITGGNGGSGIYNKGTVSGDITNGRDATISNTTNNANGITNEGSVVNIINDGTIEGGAKSGSGIKNAGTVSGDIINGSDATIRSDNNGITNSGPIANIKNSGTITGNNGSAIENNKAISGVIDNAGTLQGQIAGITNNSEGTVSAITNSGTISAAGGDGINNAGTIDNDITNSSDGTISGANSGITNSGTLANIINDGTISGTAAGSSGINNTGTGTISGDITNNASATIRGEQDGITNSGPVTNITNSGTITGSNGSGIENNATISGVIDNAGTLQGQIAGITNNSEATVSAITNSGTISAAGGDGINNTGTIDNDITNSSSGTITGTNSGITNHGTLANITNDGTISGTGAGGNGINNTSEGVMSGDITNNAGAIIRGDNSGILNNGNIANIINNGTITGANGSAIENHKTISGVIDNAGTLEGYIAGITNTSNETVSAINNTGTITASNGDGINNTGTITHDITNSGTISGSNNGINNSGTMGDIVNSGTIAGTGDNGIGINNSGTINKITNQANGTVSGNNAALNNTGTITEGIDNYGTFNGPARLGGATLSLLGDSAMVNGTITGNDQSVIHVGNADNATPYVTSYNAQVGTIDVASNSSLQLNNGTTWGASSPAADAIAIKGTYISNGSTTLAGNVTNSGSIYLHGKDYAEPGNVLNVRGNYAGAPGSKLYFNTVLGDDNSPTDKLAITGDTSGSTNVYINNKNGAGAYTDKGIELITVGGNSAGRFVQANRVVGGAYDYYLQRGTSTGENRNNWYLVNTKPWEPGDPNVPFPAGPAGEGAQPPAGKRIPIYRPEAGSYASNIMAANTLFNMTLHDRLGETQYIDPLSGERKVTSMWLRNVGGHQHTRMADGQNRTQANRYVVQMGGDLAQWSSDDLDRYHLGAMVGYGNQHSTTHNRLSHYDSKGIIHGYSTGLYGTWYQNEQDKTGMYVDSWALYNWFDNEVKGDRISAESYKSKGVTASVESGYSYKFGGRTMPGGTVNSYWVQPQVQATWMGVKADSHRENNGTKVQSKGNDNLQTRLGVRSYISSLTPGGLEYQPFFEANWVYTRKSFGTKMNGVGDRVRGIRNAALLKQGVEMKLDKNFHTWANVAETLGHNGYNDIQGMVGLKYAF